MEKPAFGSGVELDIYQYNNGVTGHVNLALTMGDSTIVAGFNAHGAPQQNSPLYSGWFDESSFLAQMQRQGGIVGKSSITLSQQQGLTLRNYLQQQITQTKSMGLSAGYALLGNNCVDGVQTALKMVGLNTHPVDYMRNNASAVYMYAAAQEASYFLPAPIYPVSNVSFHTLITAIGALTGLAGSAGNYFINTAMGVVASPGTQADGTPYSPPTGAIIVTVSRSTHTATVDYSQAQNLSVYDQGGNLVGTEPVSGPTTLPQDVVDAMLQALDQLAQSYSF